MTYAVEKKLVYIRSKNANIHEKKAAINTVSQEYSSVHELQYSDEIAHTIASRNSKAIYNMSCSLKSNTKDMSTMFSNIESQSKDIKNALVHSKELQDTFSRGSWHIANSTNTLSEELEFANDKNSQLNELLTELEDLSDMTTHLANKIKLERTYANQNAEVIDIIISKFGSYASDIRNSIIKIKSISNELNRSYNESKHDIANIKQELTNTGKTSQNISTNLDILNTKYNHILVDTKALKNILSELDITSKRITSNSHELFNIANSLNTYKITN